MKRKHQVNCDKADPVLAGFMECTCMTDTEIVAEVVAHIKIVQAQEAQEKAKIQAAVVRRQTLIQEVVKQTGISETHAGLYVDSFINNKRIDLRA